MQHTIHVVIYVEKYLHVFNAAVLMLLSYQLFNANKPVFTQMNVMGVCPVR